ncbi:MAG: DNA repair protein RecO [Planctomycetia bacterium]|nr:DNA repair protein RecO [Planctomycetia bacterium]
MPINDDAIVLRTTDFSETSMVVTFFTRENGKIPCLAKGARRLKNPFDTAFDAMNECKILFYPKRGETLQLVTEARLTQRFRVQSDTAIYAGFHVVDLLNHFCENFHAQNELFDLTQNVLNDIVSLEAECRRHPIWEPPRSLSRCLFHYEMSLLEALGTGPALRHCAECGAAVDSRNRRRAAFALLDGGVLCSNCRPGRTRVVSISIEALRVMQKLADPNPMYWRRLPIRDDILSEVRNVWNQYLSHQLERPAPVLRWLKR